MWEFFNKQSCDQSQEDESDQISTGRACDFSNSAGKSREDRKTYKSEKELYNVADGRIFKVKYVDTDHDHEVSKTDRYRTDRNRDGKWCDDTGDCCYQCDEHQSASGEFVCCCAVSHVFHKFMCLPPECI